MWDVSCHVVWSCIIGQHAGSGLRSISPERWPALQMASVQQVVPWWGWGWEVWHLPSTAKHTNLAHTHSSTEKFAATPFLLISAAVRSRGPEAQSPTVCLFPLSDFTLISHITAQCALISMALASNNDNSLACIVTIWQRMNMDSMRHLLFRFIFIYS